MIPKPLIVILTSQIFFALIVNCYSQTVVLYANITWINKLESVSDLNKYLDGPHQMASEVISLDPKRENVVLGPDRKSDLMFVDCVNRLDAFNKEHPQRKGKNLRVQIVHLAVFDKLIEELRETGVFVWLTIHFDFFKGPGGEKPVLDINEFKTRVLNKIPPKITLSLGLATPKGNPVGYSDSVVRNFQRDWDNHGFRELHEPYMKNLIDFRLFIAHISHTSGTPMDEFKKLLKERKIHMLELRLEEDEMKQVDMQVFKHFVTGFKIRYIYLNAPEKFREAFYSDNTEPTKKTTPKIKTTATGSDGGDNNGQNLHLMGNGMMIMMITTSILISF